MPSDQPESANVKGRVLIMDDERSLRNSTVTWLGLKGYEGVGASDGEEALELYREGLETGRRFDVVVLDVSIPTGMGGNEAMQRLLEMDPTVVGIVTTGYSSDAIIEEYGQLGYKGSLGKPFRLQELTDMIDRLMGS